MFSGHGSECLGHVDRLDQDLRKAVGGDQFTLLYQPLFKLAGQTNRLFGFEALLRWHHPRHGWLVPDLFIPMAEKTGLINPLGDWVLEKAMRQGQIFRAACPSLELKLNVNVSPKQLAQPNFCSRLGDLLLAEGFPPDTLCLEVTEKEFGDVAAAYVLANVRKLGVRVAIDDFGTGYSSLSYLRHLPVDIVKLDRSFLDASNDGRGKSVLRAIVALAHAMGMSVVQEGVETEAQLEMISAAGADLAQGFLFSVPLSAEDAIKLALRL